METLVQVAPGIGQHSYHPHHHHQMMVGGNAHHQDEAEQNSSRPQHERTTSTASYQPSERTSAQHQQDASIPTPSRQIPNTSRPQSHRNPSHTSVNNHSRGFDQSGFPLSNDPRVLQSSPSSPRLQPTYRSTRSLGGSEATSPSRIKVRDLSHIQSFASEEYLARPRLGNRTGSFAPGTQFEISSMPVTDIIEMVAGLLTKITTTNDRQHEHMQRPMQAPVEQGNLHTPSNCVLAFHGRNVPSITIMSYLSRIHKYCPTTYEVFLSLLVYFDRMTDNFNRRFMQGSRDGDAVSMESNGSTAVMDENDEDNATLTEDQEIPDQAENTTGPSQYFVVDSYNIHRLVIAGVTCASKFFSDVFYTNSRYAKVSCHESR